MVRTIARAGGWRGAESHISELDSRLLFLACDAGSYITGHAIAIDGGWIAR